MASNRIKGITIEIGGDTTGLDKALKETNKEISNTQSNLKDVERLLKLDPSNTELLEQRQRLLADAVQETKNKIDSLKNAEKQVQEQFESGDVSQKQYDALKREILETERALENLTEAASKSNIKLKKIADASKKIADGAAEIAGKTKALSAVATGLVGAAVATVPATKELRGDLSKLDANAEESAVSVEKAREAWRLFAIQTGETDSAVEATSNLLQAGFTESNLEQAVQGLAGAALKFPDTLKIESLADSLQETIATGSATGQFAELLDRVGIGAENFNEKLKGATTAAERQQIALQALSDAGLSDTYNAWAKNNEEMLKNEEASLKFQEAMTKIAQTIMPIVTKVITAATLLIEKFTNLDERTQMIILSAIALTAAISPIASGIAGVTKAAGEIIPVVAVVKDGIVSLFSKITAFAAANPIVLIIAAIVALVVLIATKGDEIKEILQQLDDFLQNIFAKDWTEIFGPVLGGILNTFFDQVKIIWDGVKGIFEGIIDFIQAVFAGDWEAAWEAVKDIFGSIFKMILGLAKAPLNGVISLVNAVIGGINYLIDKINSNKLTQLAEEIGINIPDIPKIPEIPLLAKGGNLLKGSAIVGEAGPELLTFTPSKATVTPLTKQDNGVTQILEQAMQTGKSGPIELTLNIDGKAFAHATYDAMKNEGVRRGTSLINA